MNATLPLLPPTAANAGETAGTARRRTAADGTFEQVLRQLPPAPGAAPDSPPSLAVPSLPPPPVEEVPAAGAVAPSAPAAEAFLNLFAQLPDAAAGDEEAADVAVDPEEVLADTTANLDSRAADTAPAALAPTAPLSTEPETAQPDDAAPLVATLAMMDTPARPLAEPSTRAAAQAPALAAATLATAIATQNDARAPTPMPAAEGDAFAATALAAARTGDGASVPAASDTSSMAALNANTATPASPAATPAVLQPAAAALTTPFGSAQWGQDLGRQLAGVLRRGDAQVALRLNPAELGPLLVELKLSEQQAQLHFASPQAAVRQAVEQAIPQLREALAEQGISLGEAQVGEHGGGADGRGAFARHDFALPGHAHAVGIEAADAPAAGGAPLSPQGGGQVNLYV